MAQGRGLGRTLSNGFVRGEVGRAFDPFCCRLFSVFFLSFSLFLLHVVVGRRLVCDLWHFLPDHTRILFVYLIKHPS